MLGCHPLQLFLNLRQIIRKGERLPDSAEQFFPAFAKQTAVDIVDERQDAAGQETADDLGLVFNHGPVTFFALLECLLDFFPFADIGDGAEHAQRLSGRVPLDHLAPAQNPFERALPGDRAEFKNTGHILAAKVIVNHFQYHGTVIGMDHRHEEIRIGSLLLRLEFDNFKKLGA